MRTTETTVAIVGAGPAGLMLANLLQRRGVPTVVVERYSREQVVTRARAGLLERRTVELLDRLGLSGRLRAEGTVHHGCEFRSGGEHFFLDYSAHCGGVPQWVYPQQEVVSDLLDAYEEGGGDVRFRTHATDVRWAGDRAEVDCAEVDCGADETRTGEGRPDAAGTTLRAEFVAGADGQHGATRASVPGEDVAEHFMQHEFRWLTLLAQAPPSAEHTVYAQHERGFAGHLLRSAEVTRFHLQVPFKDSVEDWPDERIWHELRLRLAKPGWTLQEGEIFSKNMLEMQSRVSEPMRHGRAFLLGDAAHIITPSGGKGMNLAIADAYELDRTLARYWSIEDTTTGVESTLDRYSQRRLPDVWKTQEFSHALIHMMHTYPAGSPDAEFRQKLQQSRLWQLRHSPAHARAFAESYIGPPLGWPWDDDSDA